MTQFNEALKDALDESLDRELPPRERRWLKWLRRAGWTLLGLYFLAAVVLLALRFLVLPRVGDYKDEIAAAVSRALGEKVTLGALAAEWSALHPRLELRAVRIYDRQGREALELPHVAATLAWRSLLHAEPRFKALVVDRPELRIRRDAAGRLFVAGIEARPGGGEGGLADWVLDQGEIHVRDAVVEWVDEQRGAPPLRLDRVSLAFENDGRRHRFALRAVPPAEYGSALDLRGELAGRTLDQLEQGDARLYLAFDDVDLAVWQRWVDYPFGVSSGRGALRLWLAAADRRVTELTAEVALNDVAASFAPTLPPLEVRALHGQLGYKEATEGSSLLGAGDTRRVVAAFGRELTLVTGDGGRFGPTDLSARWERAGSRTPARGEVSAKVLQLAPLAALGERLPMPEAVRQALVHAAPEGRLEDVRFAWTGTLEQPASYAVRARFSGLGARPFGEIPGFDRLSGSVELSEKGGTATVAGDDTTIRDPAVFAEEAIRFDRLAARLAWSFPGGTPEVRIEELSGANHELAGKITGVVRIGGPGARGIEIDAHIPKAEGRAVYKYIPRLGRNTARWLKRGIVAGTVADIRLQIKGDLHDFPFDDPQRGRFHVTGKVEGGELDYADRWPRFTGVAAELTFAGRRLTIATPRASALGVPLADVVVTIPDYLGDDPVLHVDGRADGPLADFLRFIAASPVREYLDGVTDGWSGDGRAKLALQLELPIDRVDRAKVTGAFQFAGNTVNMGPDEPLLSQVNGRIEFTRAGASSRGLTAQTLGGTVNVELATREGAVAVNASGTADAAQLLRLVGLPFAEHVRGVMQYRDSTTGGGPSASKVFESSLVGVTSDLPPPFNKAAADAAPLRVERTPVPSKAGAPPRSQVTVTIGKLVNAQLVLRAEAGRQRLERAAVGIGDVGVQLPDRPGVFVAGNLGSLDLDRLLPVLARAGTNAAAGDAPLAAVSLRAGSLTVLGRDFNDVAVRAQFSSLKTWHATVAAREVAGEVSWRPEGQGVVVARLKHLAQPEATANPTAGAGIAQELPALSIVADRYEFNGRTLGRLEVEAVNEKTGWRLDKLELGAPEGSLVARGMWRPASLGAEQTDLEVKIRTTDAGKYLARFGHPNAIGGGAANLDANVRWDGPIYSIDYPSLAGGLTLQASKGQFLKVDPGIAKLLGVISLQSLPRRVSLDFQDIFSEGFAFDSFGGKAAIAKGVASTDNLAMIGPAASVAITGRADIARETQDLNVRVVPAVGDSVAAAAALALLNPIVGVGALVAQRLLKDPLGQMLAFEYHVSGPWDEPKVERVRTLPVDPGAGAAGSRGERP